MRRLSDERGLTLVEMLLTLVIGLIVIASTCAVVLSSERLSSEIRARVDNAQRARVAMEQITQRLRAMVCLPDGTAPIVSADAQQVAFYADLDDDTAYDPELRRISAVLDGSGALRGVREDRWVGVTPPVAAGTAPTTSRLIVDDIAAQAGDDGTAVPLLRYFAYPSAEAAQPVPVAAVSDADRRRVVRIDIAFTADAGSRGARTAASLRSSVHARTVRRDVSQPTFDCTG